MHDAGPQSAAQLEDRRTLLPVPSTGDDNRVRDNSCGGQAPEQRVILLTAVKHRSNVHVVPGVRLSLRKRLHDALQASDFPGSHDMENQHDKALQQVRRRKAHFQLPAGALRKSLASNGYNSTPARSVESAPMGRCVSATLR
jgi:hypothetical protein